MNNKTHINDLPDVVLEYIFSQLSPYNELLACKLVCKHWYHLTYSALHKIKLDFRLAIKNLNIEWNKFATINWPNISGRYSHSSCLHSHNMYIFGGCTTGSTTSNHFRTQSNMCTTFNDLWVFDLNEKAWSKPLGSGTYPPPKACASMVSYKNKLFLYGGWSHCSAYPLNQDWKLFDDLHEFDIKENRWTLIKLSNNNNETNNEQNCPPMAGHCASVVKDKMIIYGGLLYLNNSSVNFNPISVNKDIWIYDFKEIKWAKKEIKNSNEQPSPRYGHTQIVLDDENLLIIGGCSSPKVLYSDIWILKMNLNDLNEEWYWKRILIEPNDTFHLPIFGFHQAVKVDDMVVFLSTNSKTPTEPKNQKLFRNDNNNDHYSNQAQFSFNQQQPNEQPQQQQQFLNNNQPSSSSFNFQQPSINPQQQQIINQQQLNRLQAQPSQDERRAQFLASFHKLQKEQSEQNFKRELKNQFDSTKSTDENDGPKTKNLKSSIIKLSTIKNLQRLKPNNPMVLHVLDISKIKTDFKVNWLNQIRKLDGPDEIMLYSFVAAANELILFGGIEKVPINHNLTDRKLEIVSNCVYVVSPKSVII